MNRKKWLEKQHTREEWFAKLAEEFGEVAREITKGFDNAASSAIPPIIDNGRLVTELDHVSFISTAFAIAISEGRIIEHV